ncbi:hypothetical protein HDE_04230 [Halotydeus destructor]|nr:hypothetical protein HDE_04230 [Halotydeus destructor]
MRSVSSLTSVYSEVDFIAYVNSSLSSFYVTALVDDNDLILSNPYYEKLCGENTYRLLYSEIQSLSYPFKTACENYGQGTWEGTMSRQHCAEQCALKKFQSANPGRSPEDLPLVGSWNWSTIDGKVKPFIDECLAQQCRRVDCVFKQFTLSMINVRAATTLWINVIKPNDSAFLFKHVPLTSAVDAILLVISVFGIWTGFSLMHVKKIVHRILRKWHSTRRQRSRISFVIKLVITILFALNIYTVVNEYAKYDFTTQSVCRKASMTKDFVMLMRYDGQPIKHKSGQGSSMYLANMIKYAWFRHPGTLAWKPYSSDYLANITSVYMWANDKYLAVELNSSLDKMDLDFTGSMPVFRLDTNGYQALEIFITSSRDDISQGDLFPSMTTLEPRLDVVATFESLVVTSLPAPFVFACVDYPQYGYRNKRDCTNTCIRQQGIKRYNSIDDNLVLVNLDDDQYRASDHSHTEEVRSYCTNACSRSSCLKKIYSTKQSSFRRRQQGTQSIFVDSNVQETRITYLAKVAINEFIMYLGNTFSTWFGFCFFDLTSLVTYMRKRLEETPLLT